MSGETEEDDLVELSHELCAHDPHRLPELPKTRAELQLISLCTRMMNLCLRKLGYAPARYPHDRIHIVAQEVMQGVGPTLTGFAKNGHIYLIRRSEAKFASFVHTLTHELSHYVSHTRAEARITHISGETRPNVDFLTTRSGLALVSRSHGHRFDGLNEACTEMFACEIRRHIGTSPLCMERWDLSDLPHSYSYYAQVRVISTLQFFLKKNGRDTKTLYRDYLTGSFDFVRTVNELIPGAGRTLSRMGKRTCDAIVAAKALGFSALADELTAKEPYLTRAESTHA